MRKIIVVAVREYQAAVRTKAFIVSLVAMPVMMGGSIAFQAFMKDKVDTSDKRIAVLDYSGRLFDAVADAARLRNEVDVFEGQETSRKQVQPRYLIDKVEGASLDPAQATLALSERVRKNEILAFVIIGPDAVAPSSDPTRATIAYHSNSPTYEDIQEWIAGPLNDRIQQLRLQAANLDADVVGRITQRTPVENLGLVSLDESGQITEAAATNRMANIFVPTGLTMLMFMVILIGASPLVQSALEEKTQRIAEVLLGSLPPFQLMMGKLLGMAGVSLTIVTVYLLGAYYAIHRAGFGPFFPTPVIWWFVVFQSLAVVMYGSLFIAIGAAVSDMKEAQNVLTPVMFVVVAPMFVLRNVVREPSSTMSTVLSFIPPATPMLMPLRQAVPPGIPAWQPLLGILLVVLSTLLCVFAAGRIFRVGILMQGKGARVGEMLRWVIRG
jgi:ABC-2 type transport system permease protein